MDKPGVFTGIFFCLVLMVYLGAIGGVWEPFAAATIVIAALGGGRK